MTTQAAIIKYLCTPLLFQIPDVASFLNFSSRFLKMWSKWQVSQHRDRDIEGGWKGEHSVASPHTVSATSLCVTPSLCVTQSLCVTPSLCVSLHYYVCVWQSITICVCHSITLYVWQSITLCMCHSITLCVSLYPSVCVCVCHSITVCHKNHSCHSIVFMRRWSQITSIIV